MQVCTSLQAETMPAPHRSVFYRPDALPAAQLKPIVTHVAWSLSFWLLVTTMSSPKWGTLGGNTLACTDLPMVSILSFQPYLQGSSSETASDYQYCINLLLLLKTTAVTRSWCVVGDWILSSLFGVCVFCRHIHISIVLDCIGLIWEFSALK